MVLLNLRLFVEQLKVPLLLGSHILIICCVEQTSSPTSILKWSQAQCVDLYLLYPQLRRGSIRICPVFANDLDEAYKMKALGNNSMNGTFHWAGISFLFIGLKMFKYWEGKPQIGALWWSGMLVTNWDWWGVEIESSFLLPVQYWLREKYQWSFPAIILTKCCKNRIDIFMNNLWNAHIIQT